MATEGNNEETVVRPEQPSIHSENVPVMVRRSCYFSGPKFKTLEIGIHFDPVHLPSGS
jgi:hypothetical protein